MSRAGRTRERLLPWAGLVGGLVGLGVAHRVGSDNIFSDCAGATPTAALIGVAAGLLVLALGVFGSWSVWRRKEEDQARRMIAGVSLMLAGPLLFAILMPLVAVLVIPRCFG